MKNKKPRATQLHIAEKRQTSLRVKLDGWQAALQTQKIPQNHQGDFDVQKCEQLLQQSQENITQLRTVTQDTDLKISKKRTDIKNKRSEIYTNYKKKIADAKQQRDLEIQKARKKYNENVQQAKNFKENELATLKQQTEQLGESLKSKKKLQEALSTNHKFLADQLFELEATINATFPKAEDEEIRRVILRGDVELIEKLLKFKFSSS
jgi:ribosome-binding protein aMBF1 (putative translation factor)